MANLECVNFTLKTTSINASTTFLDYLNTTISTPTGIISNNRHSMTWYNVNLRNLLGPMYDKYNAFNLCFNNFSMSMSGANYGTVASSYDNQILHVYMSGLSFLSCDNQQLGPSNYSTILRTIKLPTGASAGNLPDSQIFSDKVYVTFLKNCDNVNITIDLKTVATNTYPAGINSILYLPGHFAFNFSVYGIEEYRVLKK